MIPIEMVLLRVDIMLDRKKPNMFLWWPAL